MIDLKIRYFELMEATASKPASGVSALNGVKANVGPDIYQNRSSYGNNAVHSALRRGGVG